MLINQICNVAIVLGLLCVTQTLLIVYSVFI